MTSCYYISEQEKDEAAMKIAAISISLAKLEGMSDDFKNNENYSLAVKKLKGSITRYQEFIDIYEQQQIQEKCAHEWVEPNIYERRCDKCKLEEYYY